MGLTEEEFKARQKKANKRWREKHKDDPVRKEKARVAAAEWYAKHKKQANKTSRQWAIDHAEHRAEYMKKYMKEYYASDEGKEKMRQATKRWEQKKRAERKKEKENG